MVGQPIRIFNMTDFVSNFLEAKPSRVRFRAQNVINRVSTNIAHDRSGIQTCGSEPRVR